MIMADTQMSYGSLARYKSIDRIRRVNEQTLIGAGGEYSDFQYILRLLEQLTTDDFNADDGWKLSPREYHSYLGRVLHNRRSRVNPLWNALIVAGWQPTVSGAEEKKPSTSSTSSSSSSSSTTKTTTATTSTSASSSSSSSGEVKETKAVPGSGYLGFVDLYGSNYTGDFLATGYGEYLATPLLRKHWRADMSFADAKRLLEECMTVLLYRDCRALNKFTLGTVTATGTEVSAPYKLVTFWEHKRFIDPKM
jgi:20S proteasome subunit beta 7